MFSLGMPFSLTKSSISNFFLNDLVTIFIVQMILFMQNYNIIFLSLWSEIDEIYVWLATNVKDGKIDYEKITIDFSH